MTNTVMKIEKFEVSKFVIDIAVSFAPENEVETPRVSIIFKSGDEDRRIPMKVQKKDGKILACGKYDASQIFYGFTPKRIDISFVFSNARDISVEYPSDLYVDGIKKRSLHHYFELTSLERSKAFAGTLLNLLSMPFRLLPIKKNRILFLTNRTNTPTGNLKAVYDTITGIENADIRLICNKGGYKDSIHVAFKFFYLYLTSKIVFVDDYYHLISYVKKRKKTSLIQLWHGCGAFKTFGFSRFHKSSSLELYSVNHRQYDYAIVSSPEICDFYAEAFGISRKKVLALGSPRCDILKDASYKAQKREEFFSYHHHL